jgi:hypothetical protein
MRQYQSLAFVVIFIPLLNTSLCEIHGHGQKPFDRHKNHDIITTNCY